MNESAQSLWAAYAAGEPLVITVPHGGKRVLAGLLIVEGGLVFADIGWSWWGNVRHPFHHVSGGEVFGRGPWYIGLASIEMLLPTDLLNQEWLDWRSVESARADSAGKVEKALRGFAKAHGLLLQN